MGNSNSSASDPRFLSSSRKFSRKEIEDLNSLFRSLAAQSQSNGHYITLPVFQAYYGIHGLLGERLFDLVTQKRKDGKLTFEDLVISKGTYEKGTPDEIDEFIYQVLDVTGDGMLDRSDLEAALISTFEVLSSQKFTEEKSSSLMDIAEVMINAGTFSAKDESNRHIMSYKDFKEWSRLLPSIKKFLGGLLTAEENLSSQVPQLLLPNGLPSDYLLGEKYAWIIGGALSPQELGWKLLYSSEVNGLSFNTFLGCILGAGSTVLIIKDKDGCIFGGYASQPWERHSEFYGDMRSFLFTLYPRASIYRPSGVNNNLQWCAANFTSESIPNGIGFGGQVNHFGLFISAAFETGHTFQCSTYNSPCLSKQNRITPDVIECWGILQKAGPQTHRPESVKGTVLERFKEDRNMLNMVGIANSSD